MKLKGIQRVGITLSLVIPYCLFAGTTASFPAKLNFSGFIDGSYNHLSQSNRFISGINDRVYDLNENGFTLQQLAGTVDYLNSSGFGVYFNGMVGRDSILTNAYGLGTWTSSPDFGVDLTQAYFQMNPSSKLSIIIGKFTTIACFETIAPISNLNFSRSILFGYGTPFTAIGGRATYQATDKLKLIAGVNDGWDTITDYSRGQTVELQAGYTINSTLSFALTGYNGVQRIIDRTSQGPTGSRTLIDFVGTINATEKLSFNINYDYAWQTRALLADGEIGKAKWNGIAGYANYTFNEYWRGTVRGEVFNDDGGFRTGVYQRWKELTLTLAFIPQKLADQMEIRGEVRNDFSNVASFANKVPFYAPHNRQHSYAVEVFYKFA